MTTTDNLKEVLTVFDTSRHHLENLIKILESNDRNDGHKIANQILVIDLTLTDIQKRMEEIKNLLI